MAARKTVTIVFCDIANSTPLGQALDPEVMRGVMERYFATVRTELERHGGTVEKFIGDAVMAVFGIPTAHDDDALRAVRAAVDMRTALGALNQELERTHGVRLALRTGVNTGEVVAGDPTDRQSFATGAAVATAQRLESTARAGEILLGEPTYRLVSNAVLVEPVDALALKGIADPVPAWRLLGVVEGAPPFPRRLDTPMVGRQEELNALRAELEAAISNRRCRLATIVGPAGIGKSRLGNELFAATKDSARALVGRCLAYGEGITYWPLRGIVLAVAGGLTAASIEELLKEDEHGGRVSARLAEAIGSQESSARGEETFWAVRRFLERLASQQPLIVGIDELQWAEPTFLDLVEYLVGWASDAPILIVGLARPELLDNRPTWRATSSLVVELEPLGGGDSVRLVEALGGESLDPDERSRVLRAAEGNPLFVEQMLALAREGAAGDAMPPSIHALLTARLDRIDAQERAVLERAAVIGREFTAGAVAALSGEEPVASTLLALVRRDLIEPDRSTIPGDDGFRFRHILIRDATYLGLSKKARAVLHEQYADWLGRAAVDLHEIVGYHLEQAARYGQELGAPRRRELSTRAGEVLARVGRRATRRGDLPAAVNLLTRATALLPDAHDERRELLPLLGSALMRSGDFGRAESVLDEALEAARHAGDQRLELRTLIEREFFRTFTSPEGSGSVGEIVAVADNAIPLLDELGDNLGLAKAWWLKSEVHVNACRWGARADNLERALEYARRADDATEFSTLASQLVQALYYGPMPVEEAIARSRQLLADGRDDRSLNASITGAIAGLTAMLGDFDEARRLQAEARAMHEELGQRFRIFARSFVAAEIESLAGEPREATTILRWAFQELEDMGVTSVRSTMAAFLADSLARIGETDEARRLSELSAEQAAAEDVVTQVMWRLARARADQNGELARDAVTLAAGTDHPDLKARAFLAVAEIDDDRDARRAAIAHYEAKGNVAAITRVTAQAIPS